MRIRAGRVAPHEEGGSAYVSGVKTSKGLYQYAIPSIVWGAFRGLVPSNETLCLFRYIAFSWLMGHPFRSSWGRAVLESEDIPGFMTLDQLETHSLLRSFGKPMPWTAVIRSLPYGGGTPQVSS